MRYRNLLKKALDDGGSFREVARNIGIPVASLHNYIDETMPTEPRLDALKKMSVYFKEPISVLISEDDDQTAKLVTIVRKLSPERKLRLLAQLKDNIEEAVNG